MAVAAAGDLHTRVLRRREQTMVSLNHVVGFTDGMRLRKCRKPAFHPTAHSQSLVFSGPGTLLLQVGPLIR